jgi:aminoglycoside phosphotransferase
MRNLEMELNKKLPNSIKQIIEGLSYTIDTFGESNSLVVILEDYILKISTLSFDIENELRVYNTLEDKIPIPKIIECVKENNSIYLLKEKLKGNMLSNPYYMERPELLYKLASEAIQLLWSIDINGLDLMNT